MKNLIKKLLTRITALLIGDRDRDKNNTPLNLGAAKLKYGGMQEFITCSFFDELGTRPLEVFLVAYLLPNKTIVLDDKIMSNGNEEEAKLPPSQWVADRCRYFGSEEVIMIHNHPEAYEAKDVWPSVGDVLCTEKYNRLLKQRGISVYEHIIVGQAGVFSFRQNNLL